MASRKTYFGIGWPKDPTEPAAPGAAPADAEDRSSPTVVDDEKVAEGLRQLRSWVQSEAVPVPRPGEDPTARTPVAPPSPTGARPTAVGHATAPPAGVQQRPIAPDPMRATMYGHDVHQFEFPPAGAPANPASPATSPDVTPTPQQPPPPEAASTALVVADPAARMREALRQQADVLTGGEVRSTQAPFQMAQQGVAERLQRRPSGGYHTAPVAAPSALSRIPLASRLVFGVGIAALAAAVVVSLLSGSGPDLPPPAAPSPTWTTLPIPSPSPAAQPAPPGAAALPTANARPPATPALTAEPTRSNAVPARPVAPAPPKPGLAPVPVEPKSERPAPAVLKTPRRPREPKPAPPTETEEAPATAAARQAPHERELVEPKEVTADDVRDVRDVKEAPEPKEIKEPKAVREPKEPGDSRETKGSKNGKTSRDKARSADTDAPLPPSTE